MAKVYEPWENASPCPHIAEKAAGEGPIKPDGKKDRCQCVMCHCGAYIDGTVGQCNANRWAESNQFCQGCELEHGEKWRKMYGARKETSE